MFLVRVQRTLVLGQKGVSEQHAAEDVDVRHSYYFGLPVSDKEMWVIVMYFGFLLSIIFVKKE